MVCALSENLRGSELYQRRLTQASVSQGGSACPAGNMPQAPAGGAPGCAPRVWGHQKIYHIGGYTLPLCSRTGLPWEIHAETWARLFTTEAAAKKRVPVAGGDPVYPVLKQPRKGLFSS